MQTRRSGLHERIHRGFTLVEVLVVVVILGILATISIRVIETKNAAYLAAMESDLRNAILVQIQYFDDNQQYANSAGQLDGFVPSAKVTLTFATKPTGFTARTTHEQRIDAWCAVFMGTVTPIFSPATEEGVIACGPKVGGGGGGGGGGGSPKK